MFKLSPLFCTDFYKVDHRSQYPNGTNLIYSNLTPRSNKLFILSHDNPLYDGKVVFFGLRYFIKSFLIDMFNENFFLKDIDVIVEEYKSLIEKSLGADCITYDHIVSLHKLGYLPIEIKALRERECVKPGIPMLTIRNTLDEFYWLTNFIETALSAEIWKLCTVATISKNYRDIVQHFAKITGAEFYFPFFQVHDFSFRGMSGIHDSAITGMAHLIYFEGTDNIPAIKAAEYYYPHLGLQGCSVPATEHSVMCMGSKVSEFDTYKRIITEIYPEGIVSIVSDTWDYFNVITNIIKELKETILNRNGKVVIRPDSGDPIKIICGDPDAPLGSPEYKGSVELLWEIFGGTMTSKGYKKLNEKIGLIYGDSITLQRAYKILSLLESKGFSSDNIVFGVGSYSYNYLTRDTFGFAVKSTYGEVDGVPRDIYKNPKTDSGVKKSATGLLRVFKDENDEYALQDNCTLAEEQGGELRTIFINGNHLDF